MEKREREREKTRKGVVGEGLVLFRRLDGLSTVLVEVGWGWGWGWWEKRANETGSWVLSFFEGLDLGIVIIRVSQVYFIYSIILLVQYYPGCIHWV